MRRMKGISLLEVVAALAIVFLLIGVAMPALLNAVARVRIGHTRMALVDSFLVANLRKGRQAIEILRAIGDILEIDDARQASRNHAVRGLGTLAVRALDQRIEGRIADRFQLREALEA